MVLAIEVAKAAQPIVAQVPEPDTDLPDEDAGEAGQVTIPGVEAALAPLTGAAGGSSPSGGMPPADEDGPVWPDEAAESGMRAEVAGRGETLSSKAAREAAEAIAEAAAEKMNLPPLDALVTQISPEVRDKLEELFRIKFVKVARAPKKALKP